MSWLLPSMLPLQAHLPSGRYPLPWYHGPADQDRLADLVLRLVDGLAHQVQVPWGALDLPMPLVHASHTLVVTDPPADVPAEERDARLDRLGGRVQLLRPAAPELNPEAWQPRFLLAPLVRIVRQHLADPEHPLAALGVSALPVPFAASLSHDLLDLLRLVEAAVAHRLRFAHLGVDAEEWRESLQLAAGQRLAARTLRLSGASLSAALTALMAGPERLHEIEDGACAAEGLAQVGLATLHEGQLRLGPLACRLDDPFIRGAFLDRLPIHAWTEPARRFVVAGEMASSRAPEATVAVVPRAGNRIWGEVVSEVEGAVAALAQTPSHGALSGALTPLRQLAQLPPYLTQVPATLAADVTEALLAFEPLALDGAPGSRLAHLMTGLLRFLAARGPAAAPVRAQAGLSVDLLVRADDGPVYQAARGAVHAELAWARALTATDRGGLDDVRTRSERVRAQLAPTSAAALSLLGVEAWIAAQRGDLAQARALQADRLAAYTAQGATREAAVVQARLARLQASAGDTDGALAALEAVVETFARIGARHDEATVQGDVARLIAGQGRLHEALQLHRSRLRTLTHLGDVRGCADAQRDIARLLARERRFDEALALHREAVEAFEALRDSRAQAAIWGDIARIVAARGEFDEALTLLRQRLKVARDLGDLDAEGATRLTLGELEQQRASRAQSAAGRRHHLLAARAELGAAYRLHHGLGHGQGLADAAAAYATVLRDLGHPDEARTFVETAAPALAAAGHGAVAEALAALIAAPADSQAPAAAPLSDD